MSLELTSIFAILAVLIFDIGIRIAALGIVPNNRKPSEATAWLLAIFFVPFLGIVFFLTLGHSKLSKKRRQKQAKINELIYSQTLGKNAIAQENAPPKWFMSLASLNANLGALPLVGGNSGSILQNYEDSIKQMAKSIDKAKNYVNVEFYIMALDATSQVFFDSLAAAVARGVKVRVMFDHIGSMPYPSYKETTQFLETNKIEYQLMLPFKPLKGKVQRPDLRNHRKLMVVDGVVGYIGSQNIIDSSYNKKKNLKRGLHWFDLMVKLTGPVVYELDAVFAGDWFAETDEILTNSIQNAGEVDSDTGDLDCQIVPSGPGFEHENNLKLFNSLIYSAQHKVIITSPYFVPDESMLNAITTAAHRGLQVELYVSEIGDQLTVYHAQRSYYEELLRAGVRIYMYKAPTVLHAKHFTIDDNVTVLGSSNMDMRSFNLNLEVSLLVYSQAFVKKMRKVEAGYKANSKELLLDDWLERSIAYKFFDNVARLTSSLQ